MGHVQAARFKVLANTRSFLISACVMCLCHVHIHTYTYIKGASYMALGKHTVMNEHFIQEGVVTLQVVSC